MTLHLLRLPAELRDQIWGLCYSDFTINIDNALRYDKTALGNYDKILHKPHPLSYQVCGPDTGSVCRHIHSSGDHSYNRRMGVWICCTSARQFSHPLVCKQFWVETTQVLYKSCTWVFHSRHDFRRLLASSQAFVPHMRRIVIRSPMTYNLGTWCNEWEGALTWRLVRRLQRLEGVRVLIEFRSDCNEYRTRFCVDPDVLGHKTWKKMRLPGILRALRQHMLKGEFTGVEMRNVEGSCYGEHTPPWSTINYRKELGPWCDAVREVLLEHLPLGQGGSVSERRWADEEGKRVGARDRLTLDM
jgi:hypothetical protein